MHMENIQMDKSLQKQILGLVKQINTKCDLEVEGLTFQDLTTRDWYLYILRLLCEYMTDHIQHIEQEESQAKAIDKILFLINQLDQFDEDITQEIKGQAIAKGNSEQIFYLVQVFAALIDAAEKENEEGEEVSDENEEENLYDENMDKLVSKPITKQNRNSNQKIKRSQSQGQVLNRSVQGISNQFQKQSLEDEIPTPFPPLQQQKNKNEQGHLEIAQQKSEQLKAIADSNNNSNQDSVHYLNQKLIQTTHKSNKKKKSKGKRKVKANPEQKQIVSNKSLKKMLANTKSPSQTIKKAKSQNTIQLMRKTQNNLKKIQKKKKVYSGLRRNKSPIEINSQKKTKLVELVRQTAYEKREKKSVKKKSKTQQNQFSKILNCRQNSMKKQIKDYEESMKKRVTQQKQNYTKHINSLISKVQREKQKSMGQKKQLKDNLIQINNQTIKRMTILQQWYKSKVSALKDKKKEKKSIETTVIASNQKNNKSEERIFQQIARKYRSEEENIHHDFEYFTQKIMKICKKN